MVICTDSLDVTIERKKVHRRSGRPSTISLLKGKNTDYRGIFHVAADIKVLKEHHTEYV